MQYQNLLHDESRFLSGNTNFEKYFAQRMSDCGGLMTIGLCYERKQKS